MSGVGPLRYKRAEDCPDVFEAERAMYELWLARHNAAALATQLAEAERETAYQMGAKLEAQSVLKWICEAIDLWSLDVDGWKAAAPLILKRIETIVDAEAGAAAANDTLTAALREAAEQFTLIADVEMSDLYLGSQFRNIQHRARQAARAAAAAGVPLDPPPEQQEAEAGDAQGASCGGEQPSGASE